MSGIVCFVTLALVSDAAHCTSAAPAPRFPDELVASIPPRGAFAPTGSQLMARLASSSREERARVLVEQILEGNIPSALRKLRAVETCVPGHAGVLLRAVVWVMPDYLAVGSDEDFVRVPLGLDEALTVARRFGFTLPTRKIVNTIHSQAEARLDPKPMPAGAAMTSVAYLWARNLIREGRGGRAYGDFARGSPHPAHSSPAKGQKSDSAEDDRHSGSHRTLP